VEVKKNPRIGAGLVSVEEEISSDFRPLAYRANFLR